MAVIYDCHNDARRAKVWGTPQYNGEQVMIVEFDYAKMGGAVGDYILGAIPKDSWIIQCAYILPDAFVGSGDAETLGLTSTGSNVLITDMAGVSADTLTSGTPAINNTTCSSWIKVTDDTDIYFTIASAVITAGRMVAFIRYVTLPAS